MLQYSVLKVNNGYSSNQHNIANGFIRCVVGEMFVRVGICNFVSYSDPLSQSMSVHLWCAFQC